MNFDFSKIKAPNWFSIILWAVAAFLLIRLMLPKLLQFLKIPQLLDKAKADKAVKEVDKVQTQNPSAHTNSGGDIISGAEMLLHAKQIRTNIEKAKNSWDWYSVDGDANVAEILIRNYTKANFWNLNAIYKTLPDAGELWDDIEKTLTPTYASSVRYLWDTSNA